jgi:Tfp pilus assembly protein FimT
MKTRIMTTLKSLRLNTSKGVSIFETMMVISIGTILSATAVPGFLGLIGKESLSKAANEVISDIQKTKIDAIRENRNYQISFLSGNVYRILRDNNDNGTFEQDEIIVTGNLGARFQGISLTSTADITFSPRGTTSAATITLANGRWQKTLTVNVAGRTTLSN